MFACVYLKKNCIEAVVKLPINIIILCTLGLITIRYASVRQGTRLKYSNLARTERDNGGKERVMLFAV